MTNSPLISVIVPIYNVAAYLPRCVDSILAQTYKNLEIILVDDGSTDNCLEICQQYAQKDNRIKVIHQENKGVSAARNAGLDNMHGDFVAFVDPDDWLAENAYEILIDLHQKTGADIAWGVLLYNTSKKESNIPPHFQFPTENTEHLTIEEVLCSGNLHCVDKMYAAKLFSPRLRLNEKLSFSEDLDLILRIVPKANFVAFTDLPIYYYFMRSGSITHAPSVSDLSNDIHVWHKIYTFTKKKNLTKAISPITCTFIGVQCAFIVAVILEDRQNQYTFSCLQTGTWLRHNIKHLLFNSPMGWPGKIFMLFPLFFPYLAKWLFRLPGIHFLLRKQFNTRFAPKSKTV